MTNDCDIMNQIALWDYQTCMDNRENRREYTE